MIRSGATLESPAAGLRLVFRRTSLQTGGRAVVFEVFLEPNGHVLALHVHPRQEERVQVLAGSVGAHVGQRRSVVGPGARLSVAAGEPHRLWNAGDETAHLVVEVRPALRFESLVETLFTLAAEHGTGTRGARGLLRLAVVAAAHFDTIRLPFPPVAVQRLALALAAPVGRTLGYRSVYEPARPAGAAS